MKTIELFSGTKSFSKVAEKLEYDIFTVDNNCKLSPTLCIDILEIPIIIFKDFKWDILWASPPCTGFSVASISKHWTGGKKKYIPKSETAKLGIKLLDKTVEFISIVQPTLWYIENPRGVMRKVIDDIFKKYSITNYRRITVTYCQYGDNRMKPTDIWTNNMEWKPRPMCKNGDSCHVSAPRGSRTGTQGLKNATDRGIIPEELFYEILK
jgi:hypothetical protein